LGESMQVLSSSDRPHGKEDPRLKPIREGAPILALQIACVMLDGLGDSWSGFGRSIELDEETHLAGLPDERRIGDDDYTLAKMAISKDDVPIGTPADVISTLAYAGGPASAGGWLRSRTIRRWRRYDYPEVELGQGFLMKEISQARLVDFFDQAICDRFI